MGSVRYLGGYVGSKIFVRRDYVESGIEMASGGILDWY